MQFKEYQIPANAVAKSFTKPAPILGYETQVIGGTILAQGNSLLKDMSGSRQGFLPSWDQEKCIHCAACDTACPDFCLVWKEGEDKRGRKQMFLSGIDYQYCKGCLKCVDACPTSALAEMRETLGFAEENTVKHHHSLLEGSAE